MSQWLLKKKNKKRTEHKKNSNPEFQDIISRHKGLPHPLSKREIIHKSDGIHTSNSKDSLKTGKVSLSKQDITHCSNKIHVSNDKKCLKRDEMPEKAKSETYQEDIYNEPWDLHCQTLKHNGENCCACSASSSCNSTPNLPRENKQIPKQTHPKAHTSHRNCDTSEHKHSHIQTKFKSRNYFDIECEISNSSDESDYYEFLENIEQRLKIDHRNPHSETLLKWETNFKHNTFYNKTPKLTHKTFCNKTANLMHKTFCNKTANVFYNGYNANCADEVIYNSGSDHSSGFYELDRTFENDRSPTSNREFSEMYAFPPDEHYTHHPKPRHQPCFTNSNVYQTGFIRKGNRLLGDLIHMNYDRQQLH